MIAKINIQSMIYTCLIGLMLLLSPLSMLAQRDLIQVKDDATAIMDELSTTQNKIERVSLTKEDERSITVDVTFKGFDDKAYKVRAFVLNKSKENIQEISPVEADMPHTKQLDVTFTLGDFGKKSTLTNIESKYLRIKVVPNDSGLLNILEDTVNGISLSPFDYLFELDKKWMLSGQYIIVNVRLTPYKNAASISQNQ